MTLHEAIDFCERMAGGSHVKGADKFEAIAEHLKAYRLLLRGIALEELKKEAVRHDRA